MTSKTKVQASWYQGIVTEYRGPTNQSLARILVKCQKGRSFVVIWDHSLSPKENHEKALLSFLDSIGWDGSWVGGGHPKHDGYVWVRVP